MNGFAVFLHLLGAVIWAGGLIFVAVVAVGARRTIPERERTELFRFIGNSLLVMAGVAATLLLFSGNLLVEDRFGGWENLEGEPSTLIMWKAILFLAVLALALLHGVGLGPKIRRLRLARLEGELDAAGESSLRRTLRASTASQVLMLAGTIAILALAADMVS